MRIITLAPRHRLLSKKSLAPFHPLRLTKLVFPTARAIADGANVRAFHTWRLLDNFEWTDGYSQRYGLTYLDFRNQKRIVKDSGQWHARVAAANG